MIFVLLVVLGLVGLFAFIFSPALGVIILIVTVLGVIARSNGQKRALEERRHQELLEATRRKD